MGYLDRSIAKPSPLATTATTTSPTLQKSTIPSITEWEHQDAWVGTLIYNNTKNSIGVGIKLKSSAAEMWTYLKNSYDITDEMAIIRVHCALNIKFAEDGDFEVHIEALRINWTKANTMGAKISNTEFHYMVLESLPQSWDNNVGVLLTSKMQ